MRDETMPVEPGHQQAPAAAGGVGVPVLQHHGALAAVHRRVPIVQLSHRVAAFPGPTLSLSV
jgi:hypothetical protein